MNKVLLIAHGDPEIRQKIRASAIDAEISDDTILEVDSADGVEKALSAYESFCLAVVHLRLGAPGTVSIRSGLEVIRRIRTTDPRCVVIALTREHPGIGREAIWAGATDFISFREFDDWVPAGKDQPEIWQQRLSQRLELWRDVNVPLLAAQA